MNITVLDPPGSAHSLTEGLQESPGHRHVDIGRETYEHADAVQPLRWLGTHDRGRGRSRGYSCNEFTPPHARPANVQMSSV
ncbi:hypothetical protein GCM10010987_42180 [Bradyrhizobium guangdongense]|uniref:Uncharacterized protein n=1 Tax=Bradyrhizobium guangdongense TaxID=1325090 RepID=A0AA88B9H3_9BRAD|nr:hypothetical protein GCM10010987_42180 [Bradyrhizobium guangdongense]